MNKTTWLQKQLRNRKDEENKFYVNWKLKCKLYGDKIFGWAFLVLFAFLIPILVYYFVVDRGTYTELDTYTCLVNETFRVSCGKVNITANECYEVNCCYDKKTEACYHFLPSRYSYDSDEGEYVVSYPKTPLGTKSINKMKLSVEEINSNKVRIILHDQNTPVETQTLTETKNYVVKQAQEKLIIEIFREEGKECILSTAKGPLIASENYWEWTLYLTDDFLFGLNQTLITLTENSNFSTVIYKNKNDHHSLPIFWAYNKGKFHGVVIKHDGPLEIKILPSYLIVLRSITGGNIELELSVGPTPKEVHDQQVGVSSLPPYWTLGIHLCRKTNTLDVDEMIEQFTLDQEAQSNCINENLLMALMKNNSKNIATLKNTFERLREKGTKFLLSVPPQLIVDSELYEAASKLGLLYKYNNSLYTGTYLKENVSYPDYSTSSIQMYMEKFDNFIKKYIPIDIDGYILNDNWPVEETYKMDKNTSFPYFPEIFQEAMSYTIPWNATTTENISHIQVHNSYGPYQMAAFEQYYRTNNSKLLILSATKGIAQTQPNLIENIETSWTNLKNYLDNILFDSISGNHLVSLPVCGDTTKYNASFQETLCIRWYLIASTMPIFRITSPKPWREPGSLNSIYAEQAAEEAIRKRQMLLPYYYTILSRNEPLIRPMFYDYYESTTAFSLRNQYMIGERILVSQPLTPGKQRLQVYLPSRMAIWYELWGGGVYTTNGTHPWVNLDLRESDFVAFIAQGTIVPLLEDNIVNVIVGLNCTKTPCEAKGTLWLDKYINFEADETAFTISQMETGNRNYTLGYIKLYRRLLYSVDKVRLNFWYLGVKCIHYEMSLEKEPKSVESILKNLPEKDYKQVWRILYGDSTEDLEMSEKCLKLASRYKVELTSCRFKNVQDEQIRPARLVRVGLFQQKLPVPLTNPIRKVKTAMYTLAMDAIKIAAKGGVNIFCLQQAWNMPFAFCNGEKMPWCNYAESAETGPTTKILQALAAENKMVIISTILERDEHFEDKIWNTAVVIDNHGNFLGKYRRNHVSKVENSSEPTYYCEGNTGHPVFKTEYGKIAVSICYERHHPLNWMGFALNGAEIVFNPCAAIGETNEPLWSIEARNAAIANSYYVCAINRVGMEIYQHEYEEEGEKVFHHDSGHFFGSTYVAAPDGTRSPGLSRTKDGLLIAEFDLNMCRQIKDRNGFGVTQRLQLYRELLSNIMKSDFKQQIIKK
ncbi:hypothetical protein JTB14_024296 [Gonioctena quinquepunctata]|nr:hypothetical protein JTB14_024296 [Gonioctena quinquepunctata]